MQQTSFMEPAPDAKEKYKVIRIFGNPSAIGSEFHDSMVEDYSNDDLADDLHDAIRSANRLSLLKKADYLVLASHLKDQVVYRVSPEHYRPGCI